MALRGRQPGLQLRYNGAEVGLGDWGLQIVSAMQPLCELLDAGDDGRRYGEALDIQREKLLDADLTPSARVLREMTERGESFYDFALRLSRQHHRFFEELPLAQDLEQRFVAEAEASLRRQAALEAESGPSFEEYLRHYFAQSRE